MDESGKGSGFSKSKIQIHEYFEPALNSIDTFIESKLIQKY